MYTLYMYVTMTFSHSIIAQQGCEEQVDRQYEVYQTLLVKGLAARLPCYSFIKADTQQYHCPYKLTLIVETLAKSL